MKDFTHQMERYKELQRSVHCPLGNTDIDRAIRKAIWSADRTRHVPTDPPPLPRHRKAPWVALAAAVAAAIIIPATFMQTGNDALRIVDVEGTSMLFACNTGCNPEHTVAMMNDIID